MTARKPSRLTPAVSFTREECSVLQAAAAAAGCSSIKQYLLTLHSTAMQIPERTAVPPGDESLRTRPPRCKQIFTTPLGAAYASDSAEFMTTRLNENSVDLVMTSPPFGLIRKKQYGNEASHAYCEWFRPFAAGFRRILKESGSLVIDIGGSWNPGVPTRSLYHFDLLLMLCREYGFHLCLEHFWWNPAKLPTPAEWVNVRRIRVKDAVNCVWWLSPSPWPKASNRRVLTAYSDSMQSLLKNGYTRTLRPSGHDISPHFQRDNGGSVPPNLLAIANTESNSRYQSYCRERGLPIHPARFPSLLPEYFIRMLTDRGDLVFDPFAGSCVTGAVAEALGRKWVATDLSEDYLEGARGRFATSTAAPSQNARATRYEIAAPCGHAHGAEEVLAADGGRTRRGKKKRRRVD